VNLLKERSSLQRVRRGQIAVVDELFRYVPEAKQGKAHLDQIIDICGEQPKGDVNDIILADDYMLALHNLIFRKSITICKVSLYISLCPSLKLRKRMRLMNSSHTYCTVRYMRLMFETHDFFISRCEEVPFNDS